MKKPAPPATAWYIDAADEAAMVAAAQSYFTRSGGDASQLPGAFFWTELVQHVLAAHAHAQGLTPEPVRPAQYRVIVQVKEGAVSACTNHPYLELFVHDPDVLIKGGATFDEIDELFGQLEEELSPGPILLPSDLYKAWKSDSAAPCQPPGNPPKVVLVMEGGQAQHCYAENADIPVLVVDWDNTGITTDVPERINALTRGCRRLVVQPYAGTEDGHSEAGPRTA